MKVYDQSETDRILDDAKRKFGEDYHKLNWFTEEEAAKATIERNALLAQIEPALAKDHDGACGTKPHLGPLSPGCRICQHGGWDCSWINFRCTRNCHFCNSAEDTRTCKDRPPYCHEGVFLGPDDHALYFKLFKKKGLGISGGEPLLRLDLVLDHLNTIRDECGAPYSWLYTNGDLATPEVLQELANAGLHEIRFDIAAADYDLERVALAKRFISTVTVEIPCLPGDFDKLAALLPKMAEIGVDHLNLHQLMLGRYNYKNYLSQGYHCLRDWQTPIHESEMAALKLMKYAIDNRLNLPMNYCSKSYKENFQEKNKRKSHAELFMSTFECTTENGYVRRILVKNALGNIQPLVEQFNSQNVDTRYWSVIPQGDMMAVHPEILPQLDLENYQMKIEYFSPAVQKKRPDGFFERDNLASQFIPLLASPWFSSAQARAWQAVFMGERDLSFENELGEDTLFHGMARCERMISGFPDIY